MATPSLILVPSKYKVGKLYTEVATTSAGTVLGSLGDFSVTRASIATRVNNQGFIETVNNSIPRIDYYTSSGTVGCPALLVEPAATNFADAVQYLSRAEVPAASGGLTITTGSTDFLAPDGTSGSITKYVGGAASGVSQYALYAIGYDIAVTASGAHTLSMFVRAGATNPLNFVGLSYNGFTAASGTTLSYFSLASGTALTSGASIQNYGNGWYRLILPPLTIASGDLVGSAILYFAQGNGNANWSASGALNLTAYAWGLQMEAGSIATSYIPTNTAAVTRNADVISVSGAVSGCIGQTEGTLYTEIETQSVVGSTGVLLQIGSGNNRVYIARESATSLQLQLGTQSSAGFNFINHTFSGSVAKIAIGYASGNNAFYVNGTQVSTASATANPSSAFTEIILGISPAISQRKQRAVALYTTRLPNEELELLTYPTYYSNVRDLIWGTFVSRNSTFSELPSCLQTRHNQLIIV